MVIGHFIDVGSSSASEFAELNSYVPFHAIQNCQKERERQKILDKI